MTIEINSASNYTFFDFIVRTVTHTSMPNTRGTVMGSFFISSVSVTEEVATTPMLSKQSSIILYI